MVAAATAAATAPVVAATAGWWWWRWLRSPGARDVLRDLLHLWPGGARAVPAARRQAGVLLQLLQAPREQRLRRRQLPVSTQPIGSIELQAGVGTCSDSRLSLTPRWPSARSAAPPLVARAVTRIRPELGRAQATQLGRADRPERLGGQPEHVQFRALGSGEGWFQLRDEPGGLLRGDLHA